MSVPATCHGTQRTGHLTPGLCRGCRASRCRAARSARPGSTSLVSAATGTPDVHTPGDVLVSTAIAHSRCCEVTVSSEVPSQPGCYGSGCCQGVGGMARGSAPGGKQLRIFLFSFVFPIGGFRCCPIVLAAAGGQWFGYSNVGYPLRWDIRCRFCGGRRWGYGGKRRHLFAQ